MRDSWENTPSRAKIDWEWWSGIAATVGFFVVCAVIILAK
jgi:hypothetical protein